MSKPITIEDFDDCEIAQIIVADQAQAKEIVCVVHVGKCRLHFEVLSRGEVYEYPFLACAIRKYNEV